MLEGRALAVVLGYIQGFCLWAGVFFEPEIGEVGTGVVVVAHREVLLECRIVAGMGIS